MVKNFILFIAFCILLGVDAEFASYAMGGGLLNGSLVSIVFIVGIIAFINFILLQGMFKIYKNKEFLK